MLFGKNPKPVRDANQGAMPAPILLKIKDPDLMRILTSDDAEDFLSQAQNCRETCIDLIYDFWRLSKIVAKSISGLNSEVVQEGLQRFGDTLKKHGFFVKDMTGDTYNEGMIFDRVHFEKSNDNQIIQKPIISETIRPAIYLHDKLIRKAEVIVKRCNRESTEA